MAQVISLVQALIAHRLAILLTPMATVLPLPVVLPLMPVLVRWHLLQTPTVPLWLFSLLQYLTLHLQAQ